jgi:hypothetical protein
MLQTPFAHPPVHALGHAPPGGAGATPQPLEEDVLDQDEEADEEDEVDEEDDEGDDAVVVVSPPAPFASGSSWAPRMERHAGAARATRKSAIAGEARRFIGTPPRRPGPLRGLAPSGPG